MLKVLNSNFLQLGRRSGGRPQRTVYPRRLPVNTVIHTTLAGIEPTTFRLLVRSATSSATGKVDISRYKEYYLFIYSQSIFGRNRCCRHEPLGDGVVGKAPIMSICTYRSSGGVSAVSLCPSLFALRSVRCIQSAVRALKPFDAP